MEHDRTNSSLLVSFLALFISIAALALAWMAYNKSGPDLEQEMLGQANELRQEFRQEAAVMDARLSLLSLKTEIMTREGYQEIAQSTAVIRQNLEEAYGDASAELGQGWEMIEENFLALENNLRNESVDAIQSLQSLLEVLQREVAKEAT